ncbi:AAA family ATPase [bacterium]|nr:AAA family ATPase [bacterium]
MSIKLKLEDLGVKDSGKGFARIPTALMQELGIEPLDVVEIFGKRKSAIRLMPSPDTKNNYIKVDGITRQNINMSLNDFVTIKKINVEKTKKIVLSPTNSQSLLFNDDSKILLNKIDGQVVTSGDSISATMPGGKVESFKVMALAPSGSSIISSKTKVEIKRVDSENKENITSYDDIGGLGEQLKKIKDLVELPLKHPEIFYRLGIDAPRGILLAGPPGTGKTLLARAIANECGVNFKIVNGPEIVRKFYGESEALLREIFQSAADNQPSILFIDEIDAIAPKRDRVHGEVEKRIVGQLLALMDGLKDRGKIIVLAATNLPNSIDSALRRPGRFDKEIFLDPPNFEGRKEIFSIHSRGMPLEDDIDFDLLSSLSSGFVGADIEMVCKDAALNSVQKLLGATDISYDEVDQIKINQDNFLSALSNIQPSAIREIFVETPKVKWEEIGGLKETKEILEKVIIEPLKVSSDSVLPKGIMLYGPPGSGKTMIAKALANNSGMNFISIKGPELLSKYLGESEQLIKNFFNKARQVSPSILFFDEIDSICSSNLEKSSDSVTSRILSQILLELDGFSELNNVVILAATNKIEKIDKSLLRSGRFDLLLETPLPDRKEVSEILQIKIKDKEIIYNCDKNCLNKLKDFNGADIDTMLNLAVQFSNSKELSNYGVKKAIDEIYKRKSFII